MVEADKVQIQNFRSPLGLKKKQTQDKRTRWGINRLKSLPSLFSTGASTTSLSRTQEVTETHVISFPVKENWFPAHDYEGMSRKKIAEEERKWKELKELEKITLNYPKDGNWALLSMYSNLSQNEFLLREHVVQKEVDVSVCECSPETECQHACLNALLSIECTPSTCPCGAPCQNQKFQKCDYAKVRKEETTNCGWGLFADQNIKESDFVIEYCGEVMSDTVAQSRLHAYEAAGLKETYMMCLDGTELLDATRKGSLARFINHSCEPNCTTRKWTVLGELRIGIFAARDIKSGEELTYDYRIQCYGGTKIKCLCGSSSCVGFLGNKSRDSQESVEFDDNKSRGNAENVELDIFATSNQGDLSNKELLTRLNFVAVGVYNVNDLSAKRKETRSTVDAPYAKYELSPKEVKELLEQGKGRESGCKILFFSSSRNGRLLLKQNSSEFHLMMTALPFLGKIGPQVVAIRYE